MSDGLEVRLWETARSRADRLGFGFEPGCEDLLRRSIAIGVDRMKRDGVDQKEEKIQEAASNTERVVERMAAEARKKGYMTLHEDTHAAAFKGLCPIWPFC